MNSHDSALHWSFPAGTWFRTRVRVSVFFPLIVLVFWAHLKDFPLAFVVTVLLFVTVLLHEFGHVVGARLTGGSGDDILIWPLGGLAFVRPAHDLRSRLLTVAAGPLVNLLLCAATLWPTLQSGMLADALHPLRMPAVDLQDRLVTDLFVVLFTLNWMLFLVNLIPIHPLDGGRMLQACLAAWWGPQAASAASIRVGYVAGVLLMLAGLMADSTPIVFLGSILLVLNIQESANIRLGEQYDDSFLGYDFSQGYTSLEREEDEAPVAQTPSFFERWRQRRQAEHQQRQRELDEQAERQLDELLDKVHAHGIASLTDAERRLLERASDRYRNREKGQS